MELAAEVLKALAEWTSFVIKNTDGKVVLFGIYPLGEEEELLNQAVINIKVLINVDEFDLSFPTSGRRGSFLAL